MSKDDKKAEYTPTENVAAADVAEEATPAPRRRSLSTGAIIGLSAAGVAVILGAGFTGAAIANADHRGPDFSHGQQGGPGQQGQRDHGGPGGKHGQFGQPGMPGMPGAPGQGGPNGQFVDPDPNDNDGPGTGVMPPQGVTPQTTSPKA